MKRMTLPFLAAAFALPIAFQATPLPAMEAMLSNGSFTGASSHRTSGSVTIVKDGDTHKLIFKDNFLHDGAPDPKIAFGNNGYVKGTIIAKLKKNKGAQNYVIPARIDLAKFNEVWIWCERFGVPLGVAKLK
ncbi:MAG: DM13 domain-containing protein [Hyphomicrobiales bacterium]|nr:DM13 domain-containing protein [Hyphomicrobiales bacterium]